jgi:Leucine-rich repeat (LRR) protein
VFLNAGLTHIGAELGQLTSLHHLAITKNAALRSVPKEIGCLTALVRLDLSEQLLEHLPDSLGCLRSLEHLVVCGNRLTRLPASVGECAALTTLSLDDNALCELPEAVGRLTRLERLALRNNRLAWLPSSLVALRGAGLRVWLHGNPLPSRPAFFDADCRFMHQALAATSSVAMIRERATLICVALQELALPAPLLIEIIDADVPLAEQVRWGAKWQLVVIVKHRLQR